MLTLSLIETILLSLVQGLTEWLPISSSGHLVITQKLLTVQVSLIFNVALHFGTLLSALMFFWRDVSNVLSALFRLDFRSENGRFTLYLLCGSLPVMVAGVLLHDVIAMMFDSTLTVGVSLFITGMLLYLSKFAKEKRPLNVGTSLIVGFAQAVALIPGISRSGATIAIGCLRGMKTEVAFKFSFLLAMPAIISANLLEFTKVIALSHLDWVSIVIGITVTAVVGYLSLRLLHNALRKGKFYLFAFYCWGLGLAVLTI